jgi:hypothetical protein
MTDQHSWCTREEWTKQRRTPHADDGMPGIARNLSAYASPTEIAELIASLKQDYQRLGQQLKAAKEAATGLPTRAEIRREHDMPERRRRWEAYYAWLRALPKAEQTKIEAVWTLTRHRQDINRILKEVVKADDICVGGWGMSQHLAPFCQRWQDAHHAHFAWWTEEIKKTPCTDEDWERELEHRQWCVDRFGAQHYSNNIDGTPKSRIAKVS